MRQFVALVLLLAVTGCAQPIKTVWLRIDGAPIKSNPVMAQQFEVDTTVCQGETSKAHMSGTQICRGLADCIAQSQERGHNATAVARGCMAERGYVNVPEDQAEAKAAELRAVATASAVQARPAKPMTAVTRR